VFDPIRSYDKPAVIISQLANGIATTNSVSRVLFDPASLSPRERESFVDKVREEYGGNPVADTAINVLGNPLVWLGLLTLGTGGVAARNLASGRRFFAGGQGTWAGDASKAMFPFLRMVGFTSGSTESIGRRISALAQAGILKNEEVTKRMTAMMEAEVRTLLDTVSRKHNVKLTSLDPDEAPNQAVARDLKDIRNAILVRALGFEKNREETFVKGVSPDRYHIRVYLGKASDGSPRFKAVEVPEDVFMRVREHNRTGLESYDLADPADAALLGKIPGLDPEVMTDYGPEVPTLLDSVKKREQPSIVIKAGLDPTKLDPEGVFGRGDLGASSVFEGGPRVDFETVARAQYVSDIGSLEAVEREFGLDRFNQAQKKFYEYGRVLLAGNEEAYAAGRGFVVDRDKILRSVRARMKELQNVGAMDSAGMMTSTGEEAVRNLLSDDVASRLMTLAGKRRPEGLRVGATKDEIENLIVETMAKGYEDPYYIPRNTIETRDKDKRVIAYNPYTGKREGPDGDEGMAISGRTFGRTRTTEVPWNPEDLKDMAARFGGTEAMFNFIDQQEQRVRGQIENQNFYRTMRVAPDVAADKYVTSVARDYTFFVHDAAKNPAVRIAMQDLGQASAMARLPGPVGASGAGAPWTVRDLEAVPDGAKPAGGYSLYDLMETDLDDAALQNPRDKNFVNLWRKHIIPAISGIRPVDEAAHVASATLMQEAALRLANSKFMTAIEARGGYGGRIVRDLRRWATDSTGLEFSPFTNVTRGLYASHMGLNMGTVIMNLMQPLQSIHQLGFKNTVRAYSQAFEMIGSYAAARSRLGPGATRDQVQAAMEASFRRKFGDTEIDLTRIADIGSTWEMMEKSGWGAKVQVGKPKFSFLEFVMKPFQLSETLNRTVTANAVLNAYQRAGRMVGDDVIRAQVDAMEAVQQFQFGTSPINRPSLFYAPVLREPAFRQFAQYGLRSFANLFTVPAMMGGTRSFAGREVSSTKPILGVLPSPVTMVDITRMMAVSAVTYEVGKSVFGADLSRGLAMGMTDLVGGQQALAGEDPPLYIPPIVDLGWQGLKFMSSQDIEILKDLVPRTVPAGVAMSRLLGSAAPVTALQDIGLQRTYVDWRQAENGMAPVFKSDGRFMGQFPTSDIVLKAFGADLGRFSQPQELSQFLLKNRDAIREGRRRYIAAVLGNNMGAAAKVKAEFERRFGLPLTVTQEQMKSAIKLREESVVGRTLETIDRTVRDVYQQAVAEALPGQLMGAEVPQPMEQGDMYRWSARGKTKAAGGDREGT